MPLYVPHLRHFGKSYIYHLCVPLAKWLGLEVSFFRVMSSIPTQWTSMYVLVGVKWLNKLKTMVYSDFYHFAFQPLFHIYLTSH
jgi:hypothetical protein